MKITKRTKNCVTAAVVALFAVAGYLYCQSNVLPTEGTIGSMYTPKLLCLCLLVLAVIKFAGALRDDNQPQEVTIDRARLLTGAGTIVLIGLYCFLFRTLGFVIVTFLYLIGQMALFYPEKKRRWTLIILIAVLTTAAAYLIFSVAFNLMLPLGPLKNILIF